MTSEDLKPLVEDLRRVSTALWDEPCSHQKGDKPSCLQAEEARPLTKAEKDKGWSMRPFYAYDESRMCGGCCAYWHVQRAEVLLHEIRCWRAKAEARKEAAKT